MERLFKETEIWPCIRHGTNIPDFQRKRVLTILSEDGEPLPKGHAQTGLVEIK
jgi:hypothetical protein